MSDISCREFIDFLDDYVAGGQTSETREEFEKHIALCPPCLDYLRSYKDTIDLVRACCEETPDAPPADAPEKLVQAILAARKKGQAGT